MIDLKILQQQLNKKTQHNNKFGKSYFLDQKNLCIIKIKPKSYSQFEYECIRFLCNYYKTKLHLNFKVYKYQDKLITVSPIVKCLYDLKWPKEKLIQNTLNILNIFATTNSFFKDILIDLNLSLKIYVEDCSNDSFFIFNNEIYLLDMESFYFCIYTPDQHSIGLMGIKEEYEKIIRSYQPISNDSNHLLMNEMLIY